MRFVSALAITLFIAGCGEMAPVSSANEARQVAEGAPNQTTQPSAGNGAEAALPADVASFKEKRDTCDHFRGEEAYDAERGRFLAEQLAATCAGTDKALADLRAKYAGDPAAAAALAEYEAQVE